MAASVAHRARPGPLITGLIFAFLLTACGGGGSTAGGGTTQTLTLNGTVSMGDRVRAATITARLISDDGTDGGEVGSGTTTADGQFTFSVTAPSGAALRLAVSGGLVSDQPTGQDITVTSGALVLDLPSASGSRTSLQITPITTFAHKAGLSKIASGQGVADAIAKAYKEIGVQFGITTLDANGNISEGDITTTVPKTGGAATAAQQRHELALLALAQQAKDLNVSPMALVSTLARDAEDGVFDGKFNTVTINLTTTVVLPADATSTRFVTALTSFLQSAQNTTGLTTTSTVVTGITNTTVITVSINPTSALISVGQSQQFSATALNYTGGAISGPLATWTSSKTAIAAVSSSGLATGIGAGTTTIIAAVGGVKSSPATLTVAPISASALPSAPTGLSVTAGNGQATISWNLVSGATSHTLYMATTSWTTWATTLPGAMVHANVTSPYTHTGLTNGTTYWFAVSASNILGESAQSAQVSAIPNSPLTVVAAIEAGGERSCAMLLDSTLKCWGSGRLGNGTDNNSSTPVTVSGITTATAIGTGGFAHTCTVLSGGTVKCWGTGGSGSLGDGSMSESGGVPVLVTGITTATAVAASGAHACARLSGGTVKCWGLNTNIQLGDGSDGSAISHSFTPLLVSDITTAASVAAGVSHSCAPLLDGTVKCWGKNLEGQLGDGTTTNRFMRVTVSGITTAAAIKAGESHTCALLSGGTVKCWGLNTFGQLGDGTANNSSTPVTVSGLTTATSVAAGYTHTCARLSGGTVKCWGRNQFGELGDGTTTNRALPVAVSGITTATSVAAGMHHTCALLADGTVKCWGYNNAGELGDGTTMNRSTPVTVSGF